MSRLAQTAAAAAAPERDPATPEYRCGTCGTAWSYRAVRHVARCRDCGGGLVREEPAAGRG
jgi:DNA-directed RNA polymerase subunit RPC12/RpoP